MARKITNIHFIFINGSFNANELILEGGPRWSTAVEGSPKRKRRERQNIKYIVGNKIEKLQIIR